MFDFITFANTNKVPIKEAGHKHVRSGWVQCPCPFCFGNEGYHLGYNLSKGFFNCWRCGRHTKAKVISRLMQFGMHKAHAVLEQYQTFNTIEAQVIIPAKSVVLPNTTELPTKAKNYLEGRNFDPDKLVEDWGLMWVPSNTMYGNRILAPIYHEDQLVSYQCRAISPHAKLKYMACAEKDEVRKHKHCLYGLDQVYGDTAVVVEGVFDAWRLGQGAVATFGIKWTIPQVQLLRRLKRVYVFFDSEVQAVRQSDLLAAFLDDLGVSAYVVDNKFWGDPADLPQTEADDIMKDLLGGDL